MTSEVNHIALYLTQVERLRSASCGPLMAIRAGSPSCPAGLLSCHLLGLTRDINVLI